MILIFDCNGLLFRWYNRKTDFFPDMITTLYLITRSFNPEQVYYCFDYGRSKYRLSIYPEYKANRDVQKEKDLDHFKFLYNQLDLVYKFMKDNGDKVLRFEGIEADDLIAYITLNTDKNCLIISEDYDLLQLPATLYSLKKQQRLTLNLVYNCNPEQFIIAKAMAGDTSDNIKGIERIGLKTAFKIIQNCGLLSIEDLELLPEKLKAKKRQGKTEQRIIEGMDIIYRNIKLVDLLHFNEEIIKDIKPELEKILK